MPQLFRRRSNAIAKLSVFFIFAAPTALFALLEFYKWSPFETEVLVPIAQPVPFSHAHHVGELLIDCRYCHSLVEDSPVAGLPPSETCMNCHSQIWQGAPMLEPVHQSFKTKEPIAWNQVHRLPKYVYFDHSIHVQKGIGCSSCHGNVDRMPLMEKVQTFYMRDCLACHRNPENYLRPMKQIFNPRYEASLEQITLGQELLEKYNIDKTHLMDCYSCHR